MSGEKITKSKRKYRIRGRVVPDLAAGQAVVLSHERGEYRGKVKLAVRRSKKR